MANSEIGTINTEPTGGVTPVRDKTYQSYSYSFTATSSQEYINFLFRNDPGFTWLDDVSVVAQGDATKTNLVANGGFEAGGQAANVTIPVGWTQIGGAGIAFAGSLGTATDSIDEVAIPHGGTYFWVDGATNAYDGLAQRLNLTVGVTYTLNFALAVDPVNRPLEPIDTQIWVGDTIQAPPVACFTKGTRLLTLRGEMPVESLSVGDLVVTLSGKGAVLKPVTWIGSTAFDAGSHPRPDEVRPIRIRAGALGDGLPHRDLIVSPGHSLLLEGWLMQAERLLNGATILREPATSQGEYFHVELDGHDIVLSEGVPSESYLDTGNRAAFGDVVALHPDFSPRHWSQTCVPLVQDDPALASTRARLLQRALELGWRRDDQAIPLVMAAGRRVSSVRRGAGIWAFAIPDGVAAVRLVSDAGRAADVLPDSVDTRRLGLWVDGLAVIRDGARHGVALDDATLTDGWHAVERHGDGAWRWTDGDAGMIVAGPCELEISVGCGLPIWRAPELTATREALAG